MDEMDDMHIMRKQVNHMFTLLCAKRGCNDIELFLHILYYIHSLLKNKRINGRLYTNESHTDLYLCKKHMTYIKGLLNNQKHKNYQTIYEIQNEFNILSIIAIEAISVLLQHELSQF